MKMKMKIKRILFYSLFITLTFSSCKKEGCTDSKAENYSEEANEDDGSCEYAGEVVVWWNQTTSDNLMNDGIDGLYLFLDGVDSGQSWTGVYWSSAPSCGDSGVWTVPKNLGNSSSVTYDYEIKDEIGNSYDSGTVTISAGNCQSIEFAY